MVEVLVWMLIHTSSPYGIVNNLGNFKTKEQCESVGKQIKRGDYSCIQANILVLR
jgi:hypothetical protein